MEVLSLAGRVADFHAEGALGAVEGVAWGLFVASLVGEGVRFVKGIL